MQTDLRDEPEQRERSEAGAEAKRAASEAESQRLQPPESSGGFSQIRVLVLVLVGRGNGVPVVDAEVVRVVGGGGDVGVLEQPGGDVGDAGGVSQLPPVRDGGGVGAPMPPVQGLRFAQLRGEDPGEERLIRFFVR